MRRLLFMLRAIALALRGLREIFLMTQPPLLAVMQGGEFALYSSSRTL
jgi:hypothetical protein